MREEGWEKETLEMAQMTKLDRFIDNARIRASDHVLEIGTGWGSLAMRAVQRTGCRVTSLTLSTEQKALAEERIAAAGLTDRIEVLLCDYRALPLPRGEHGKERCYDKVVSIEMLEAVGEAWLEKYFECVDKLLKREGGVGVFQCITMPETVSLIFLPFAPGSHGAALYKVIGTCTDEDLNSATQPTPTPPTSFANTFFPAVISPPFPSLRAPSPLAPATP